MADDENPEPNLELPKLFGRKKRSNQAGEPRPADSAGTSSDRDGAQDGPTTPPVSERPPTAPPAEPGAPAEGPATEPSRASSATRPPRPTQEETSPPRRPSVSPAARTDGSATPPPPRRTAATPPGEQRSPAASAATPPRRAESPAVVPPPQTPSATTDLESTAVQPAADLTPDAAPAPRTKRSRPKVALPTAMIPRPRRRSAGPAKAPADPPSDGGRTPRRLPALPLPSLSGRTAAVLTGVFIGFALTLSTAGVLRGCEAVRGTKSCGGSGGFALLLVLIVAAIYLGGLLLRAFSIPDPASTSFLAVGIVVVLAMLLFIDSLLDWWMFLLIPVLSAGAYALSHFVTTALVEPASDQYRDQRVK